MPLSAERMSRVDTAWLRMDNDVNLMMIVGIWLLEPAVPYDMLCERVADKLLKYDRFRQKVVQDTFGPSWVEDTDFDIGRHVLREPLTRKRGESERKALQRAMPKKVRTLAQQWRRRAQARLAQSPFLSKDTN